MNKYIAIMRTLGEVGKRRPDQKKLPDSYPVEMEEFEAESLEAAQALYPGKLVMLASIYAQGYQKALTDIYEASQPKPNVFKRMFGAK